MQIILKNRVNSGNAKVSNDYANPEPSQGYILGRCRDYRRGSALLITGFERPTSQVDDDIVRAYRNIRINATCLLAEPLRLHMDHYLEDQLYQSSNARFWVNISPMLKKFNIANSSNSGKLLTDNAEDNPERSHYLMERATTSRKTYTQAGGNGEHPNNSVVDGDMVFSAWKHAAAKAGQILRIWLKTKDTGDIMLCDFSQYKAIDKGGMQGEVSIHVQFVTDQSVFRFVYRFDGQPVLSSAITPFSAGATTATDTLSHFVKLDSR